MPIFFNRFCGNSIEIDTSLNFKKSASYKNARVKDQAVLPANGKVVVPGPHKFSIYPVALPAASYPLAITPGIKTPPCGKV